MLPDLLFIVQLVAAVVSLGPFLATFWFKRTAETSYYRALVLIAITWALLYGLELKLPTLEEKVIVMQVRYMVQPFAVVVAVMLAAKHFRWDWVLTTKAKVAILIIPVLNAFISATNGYTGWLRDELALSPKGDLTVLTYHFGPWFPVLCTCIYILSTLTILITVNAARGPNRMFARQGTILAVAIMMPLVADLLFILDLSPIEGYNFSSAAFTLSSPLIFWGIFRLQMLDIKPIARAQVMMQMDDPVMVFDDKDRLIDFNPAARRAFHWEGEGQLGKNMSDVLPEFFIAGIVPIEPGHLREFERPSLEGRVVYEVKITNVIIDEVVSERIVILRDVTSRRDALDALKENERKYRELLDRAPFPIIITAIEDGEVMYLNKRTAMQFEIDRKGALSRNIQDFYVNRQDRTKLIEQIAKTGMITDFETRMLTTTGRPFWAYISAMIMNFEGRAVLFSALNDITERKRIEETLQVTNTKLNLLSSITRHDLMNQLTVLYGYMQLAERSNDVEKTVRLFDKMEINIKAIQTMIEFTKVYQDLGVTAPGWFDLAGLIETASSKLNLSKIELRCDIHDVQVYGDALLEKVFYNIMENSLRHGDKVTSMSFVLEDLPTGKAIVFQDDGSGISAEDKERIFQRGFGKNSGLGLFLSREILSITGMTINENGEPGKGVRFEIFVPCSSFRDMKGRDKAL